MAEHFFLQCGMLIPRWQEVPDTHLPVDTQRRFPYNPPVRPQFRPDDNTRNALDSSLQLPCNSSADRVRHTGNGFCAVPFWLSEECPSAHPQNQPPELFPFCRTDLVLMHCPVEADNFSEPSDTIPQGGQNRIHREKTEGRNNRLSIL